MSLEAAIGRIDSIIQLQQQILDPSASTSATASGSAATAGATAASPASAAGESTFATMLAGAQQSTAQAAIGDPSTDAGAAPTSLTDPISAGVTSSPYAGATGVDPTATGATGATGATAATSAGAPAQVQAMVGEADSLVGKPYVWGGGHSGWGPQTGYDCSGFVSAVLHAGGYLSSPQDTVTLPSAPGMAQGPGQYVTVYDRTGAGEQGHVIIDIAGQFYESGGGHGAWGGGGGVEKIGRPSAAYLATFDTLLHPQGL